MHGAPGRAIARHHGTLAKLDRCGDEMMRKMLYGAAHVSLVRTTKWSWLKAGAMQDRQVPWAEKGDRRAGASAGHDPAPHMAWTAPNSAGPGDRRSMTDVHDQTRAHGCFSQQRPRHSRCHMEFPTHRGRRSNLGSNPSTRWHLADRPTLQPKVSHWRHGIATTFPQLGQPQAVPAPLNLGDWGGVQDRVGFLRQCSGMQPRNPEEATK
jgi:hypothetical protein